MLTLCLHVQFAGVQIRVITKMTWTNHILFFVFADYTGSNQSIVPKVIHSIVMNSR